jgi:hypothetical protein
VGGGVGGPQRGPLRRAVVPEALPVGEVRAGQLRRFDQQGVVGLAAQGGVGPVGAAGQDRPGVPAAVDVDDELVVPDVAVAQQAVAHVDVGLVERLPGGDVGPVVGAGVGEDEVDEGGADQGLEQLGVVQLVQGGVALPPVGAGPLQQEHQGGPQVAGQAVAERVAGLVDAVDELAVAGCASRPGGDLVGEGLRGEDAAVEVGGDAPAVGGEVDRVGGEGVVGQRGEAPGGADHRHDLVLVEAVGAGRQVAPGELLHGPDLGGLRLPALVGLAAEGDPGGQRGGHPRVEVGPVDREPQAVVDPGGVLPRQEGDVIVGQGDGFHGTPSG